MKVVGIDLAGKEENPTGFCVLGEGGAETEILRSDEEIVDRIEEVGPNLIAVDAPLDFPEKGMYRKSDLELKRKGFDALSPNFPGMKMLVKRARDLLNKVDGLDLDPEIIEVFPEATEETLGLKPSEDADEDEFDALLCAITGEKYLKGECKNLYGVVVPES